MKVRSLLCVGVLSVLGAGCAVATEDASNKPDPVTEVGKVKIEWQSPDKYRDVKTATESQSKFQQRLYESLTKALDKAAAKSLKGNEKLELVVTDVDLAGDLRPTFGQTSVSDLRIVKDIFPPRIEFSYKVVDGEQVIMIGTEKLKDLGFMDRSYATNNSTFRYEEEMLEDWFSKTVAPKL